MPEIAWPIFELSEKNQTDKSDDSNQHSYNDPVQFQQDYLQHTPGLNVVNDDNESKTLPTAASDDMVTATAPDYSLSSLSNKKNRPNSKSNYNSHTSNINNNKNNNNSMRRTQSARSLFGAADIDGQQYYYPSNTSPLLNYHQLQQHEQLDKQEQHQKQQQQQQQQQACTVSPKDAFLDFDDVASRSRASPGPQSCFPSADPPPSPDMTSHHLSTLSRPRHHHHRHPLHHHKNNGNHQQQQQIRYSSVPLTSSKKSFSSTGDGTNIGLNNNGYNNYNYWSHYPHINSPYYRTHTSPPPPPSSSDFIMPPNAVPWESSNNTIKQESCSSDEDYLAPWISSQGGRPDDQDSRKQQVPTSGLFQYKIVDNAPGGPFDETFFTRRTSSKIPSSDSASTSSSDDSSDDNLDHVPFRHPLAQSTIAPTNDDRDHPPKFGPSNIVDAIYSNNDQQRQQQEEAQEQEQEQKQPQHEGSSKALGKMRRAPSSEAGAASTPSPSSSPKRRRKNTTPRPSAVVASERIRHPSVERLKLEDNDELPPPKSPSPYSHQQQDVPVQDAQDHEVAAPSTSIPTPPLSEDAGSDFDLEDNFGDLEDDDDDAEEDEDYHQGNTPDWTSSKRKRGRQPKSSSRATNTRSKDSKRKHSSNVGRPTNAASGVTSSSPSKRSRKFSPDFTGEELKCDFFDPTTGKRCETVFRRPYDRTRHLDTVHAAARVKMGEKGVKTPQQQSQPQPQQPQQQKAPRQRKNDHHGPMAKPAWIPRCDECGGIFSRKDALIRHCRIRGHHTELPSVNR